MRRCYKKAIREQGPQGQAGDICKKEGIQYEDVLQLRLDYTSMNISEHFIKLIQFVFNIHCGYLFIFKRISPQFSSHYINLVQNMGLFSSPKYNSIDVFCRHPEDLPPVAFHLFNKLQLDNNVIERIEGLENLTNLVWLGEFRLSCRYQNRCGH